MQLPDQGTPTPLCTSQLGPGRIPGYNWTIGPQQTVLVLRGNCIDLMVRLGDLVNCISLYRDCMDRCAIINDLTWLFAVSHIAEMLPRAVIKQQTRQKCHGFGLWWLMTLVMKYVYKSHQILQWMFSWCSGSAAPFDGLPSKAKIKHLLCYLVSFLLHTSSTYVLTWKSLHWSLVWFKTAEYGQYQAGSVDQ